MFWVLALIHINISLVGTCVFLSGVSKSGGCSIYTSYSMTPFRKDVFTPIWCNFHFIFRSQRKNSSDWGISSYLCKILFIINPFLLRESSCDKYFFELFNISICRMSCLENPFWRDHWFILQSWHHIANIIIYERPVFFDHGIYPFLLLLSFFKTCGFFINKVAH